MKTVEINNGEYIYPDEALYIAYEELQAVRKGYYGVEVYDLNSSDSEWNVVDSPNLELDIHKSINGKKVNLEKVSDSNMLNYDKIDDLSKAYQRVASCTGVGLEMSKCSRMILDRLLDTISMGIDELSPAYLDLISTVYQRVVSVRSTDDEYILCMQYILEKTVGTLS